jgi:serine/threonine protein kinase
MACNKKLGSGTYGEVLLECTDKNCEKCHVRKKFILKPGTDQSYAQYNTNFEIRMLRKVTNLVKNTPWSYYIIKMLPIKKSKYEIVTEYFKDFEVISMLHNIGVDQLKAFLIQIFGTLDYLFRRGILHMDLYPKNILAVPSESKASKILSFDGFSVKVPDVKYQAKLIDWGIAIDTSRLVTEEGYEPMFYKNSEQGGECYMPYYDFIHLINALYEHCDNKAQQFLLALGTYVFSDYRLYEMQLRTYKTTKRECTEIKQLIEKNIVKLRNFSDIFLANYHGRYLFDVVK